jgi:hypothetical protein
VKKRFSWILAIPFVLVACDDKKVDDKTAASASAALSASAPVASASAAPSASVAASAAPAAGTAIPSHADEALKAAKEIDKANYKQELDKLDKEITAR